MVLFTNRSKKGCTQVTTDPFGRRAVKCADINGINIQQVQLVTGRRKKSIETLRDIGYRILELSERPASILHRLSRHDAHALISGSLYGNQIFALQSVVQPIQPMMDLQTHAQVVHIGQDAALNFASFSQCTIS